MPPTRSFARQSHEVNLADIHNLCLGYVTPYTDALPQLLQQPVARPVKFWLGVMVQQDTVKRSLKGTPDCMA